jgi:hypothetical protein
LVATDEVGHVGDSLPAQQAGRDRRPVAAGAVGDYGARRVELTDAIAQLDDRDVGAALDEARGPFADFAHVQHDQVADFVHGAGELPSREAAGDVGDVGTLRERRPRSVERAHYRVEADPAQTHPRFAGAARVAHEDDLFVGVDDIAGILRESSSSPTLIEPQVTPGEGLRGANVEHHRAVMLAVEDFVERQLDEQLVVKQRMDSPLSSATRVK